MDSWQAAQLAASSICIKMKRWCWDNFTGCKQRPLYLFFHKTIPVLKEHNLHCCQQRYGGISRELSFCSLWTKDRHPITAICFFRLNLKVLVMLIFTWSRLHVRGQIFAGHLTRVQCQKCVEQLLIQAFLLIWCCSWSFTWAPCLRDNRDHNLQRTSSS